MSRSHEKYLEDETRGSLRRVTHANAQAQAQAQAREIQSEPSKLLEYTHGERLDPGATGAAIPAYSHLVAVGAIHGPEDAGREGEIVAEPIAWRRT